MKKLVASLTLLFVFMGAAQANWMTVLEKGAREMDRMLNDMPTPLKGKAYDTVFTQYRNEPLDDWDNHNFKKIGEMRLSYCKRGLPEACGDYGEDFMVGLYTKRDISNARKYLNYAIRNVKTEGKMVYYELDLYVADDLAKYSDDGIIETIKSKFNAYASDCINKRGVKDTCAIALVYSTLVPTDMLGLSEKELESMVFRLYLSDIGRNGVAESKISKIAEDLQERN
jgi:hypothetical protein|nr:hypothetical protein [uncultured Campylobacter sp.]